MQVTKCDICKKEIKSYKEGVRVSPPVGFLNFEICLNCGKPIIKFLQKHHLGEKVKK